MQELCIIQLPTTNITTFIYLQNLLLSMDLKEIKKEVNELENVQETLKNFQDSWVRPLRQNNAHLPFLKKLSGEAKEELNSRLLTLQDNVEQIQSSQLIHDNLRHHSYSLVELKLCAINGDKNKAKMLASQLSSKDYGIKNTINQIRSFQENVSQLSEQYEVINQLLQKHLSLEEMVYFMQLPHKKYLRSLLKTSEQHQKIVRDLGRHFITIAEEVQTRKGIQR